MSAIRLAAACAAALSAGLLAQSASAACYVVYGADKQLIYRSQTPPVDLSRPLHETVAQIAPGGTLVFSLDNHGCELEINHLPGAGAPRGGAADAAPPARTPPAERR
ncbi:hypothetical protein [Alicycliphilus denitrificans]|uniref:hypothetical protein n=1 Tax=Alicycliphilus denitrificans TaxID=179636 RepID=UPI003A7F8F40